MLIGIDFDNTIIDYSEAFDTLAKEWNLVQQDFMGSKIDLREYLKQQAEGHDEWMRLQGYIYGKGVGFGKLMPGFIDFMLLCEKKDIPTVIVSHKTLYGHYDAAKINLRDAALNWMEQQGFFGEVLKLAPSQIYFAASKEEKIECIKKLNCSHFIDDLLDIYTHEKFPKNVQAYFLGSEIPQHSTPHIHACRNWDNVSAEIFATQ